MHDPGELLGRATTVAVAVLALDLVFVMRPYRPVGQCIDALNGTAIGPLAKLTLVNTLTLALALAVAALALYILAGSARHPMAAVMAAFAAANIYVYAVLHLLTGADTLAHFCAAHGNQTPLQFYNETGTTLQTAVTAGVITATITAMLTMIAAITTHTPRTSGA